MSGLMRPKSWVGLEPGYIRPFTQRHQRSVHAVCCTCALGSSRSAEILRRYFLKPQFNQQGGTTAAPVLSSAARERPNQCIYTDSFSRRKSSKNQWHFCNTQKLFLDVKIMFKQHQHIILIGWKDWLTSWGAGEQPGWPVRSKPRVFVDGFWNGDGPLQHGLTARD
jgi:hypothetical protein